MKFGFLALILLVASCAPTQPYRSGPGTYTDSSGSGTSSGGVTSETRPANSYSQDTVECERKAALSQAGGKGEAFANCMRSRGHTPGRN
jgi:hypothetical protein